MHWLRHAFAIDDDAAEPPSEQAAAVERLCQLIARRGLGVAAIAFLEASRPLNYLGAQSLHFLTPFLSALGDGAAVQRLAEFLERRDAIDRIVRRLTELEQPALKQPAVGSTDSGPTTAAASTSAAACTAAAASFADRPAAADGRSATPGSELPPGCSDAAGSSAAPHSS